MALESVRLGGLLAVLLVAAPGPAVARALPAHAAAADSSRLGLRVGPTFDAHTDLLASPFRQSGTGPALGVGFAHGAFSVDLLVTSVGTSSSLDGPDAGVEDGWMAGLDVAYLRPVGGGARTTVRAGVGLSGLAFVRRHHYGRSAPREYFADLVFPVSAVGEVSRVLGTTVVDERVGVGLVAVLFRSPWAATKTFPDASLAGPASLRVFHHRMSVTWAMSPRIRLQLTHELRYYDTDRNRLVRVVQQQLGAGLGIVLGGSR